MTEINLPKRDIWLLILFTFVMPLILLNVCHFVQFLFIIFILLIFIIINSTGLAPFPCLLGPPHSPQTLFVRRF